MTTLFVCLFVCSLLFPPGKSQNWTFWCLSEREATCFKLPLKVLSLWKVTLADRQVSHKSLCALKLYASSLCPQLGERYDM